MATSEQNKEHIIALLAEREHYERYSMPDRAAQVDEALREAGHKAKVPRERAVTMKASSGDVAL